MINYLLIPFSIVFLTLIGLSKNILVKPQLIKQWSLIQSIVLLYIIIYFWYIFDTNYIGYQFISNILNIEWGVDGISLILIILTIYLLPIALLSNWNNIKSNTIMFSLLVLLLGLLMILNFICLDIISFYVLFESTLAPLFILIGIYGAKNRDKAAYYVLIYTLASSLWMLLSIAIYLYLINSADYIILDNIILSLDLQSILFIGIFIGIAVKTPLMPVHTWLPVVHSESPLAGSILLAGIILKLAIYAIVRLLLPNLTEASLLYTPFIYVIAIITIIYTSLITLRQVDLKVIIAYSSISHLAVCILGIFANNLIGIQGSLLLSLAHGFVSPALFIIVGGILYDRYHNRLILYYQGLSQFMPILAIYLIIFSFCNTGTPLSLNFIGELLSLSGAFNRNPILTCIACLSVLLSASYQMKLTNRLTGGVKSIYLNTTKDLTNRELVLMNYLLIPTILLGLYPTIITSLLDLSTSTLLYHLI